MEIDNERTDRENPPGDVSDTEGSQGTTMEVRVPGFIRRAMSSSLDFMGAALIGLVWLVEYASTNVAPTLEPRWSLLDQAVDVVVRDPGFALLVIQSVVGSLLCWHLFFMMLLGRTPGHFLMGLVLVNRRRQRPTGLQAFVHGLIRLGSLCVLGCGHVWFFIDPERRTLYDRLAGLYVVVHSPQRISE